MVRLVLVDSHWLKNWRDSFKPITKRSNCNHVITFDSHLKTALYATKILWPLIPICRTSEQFCRRYVNWFNCQRSLWVQQRRVLEQFCNFDFGLGITVCRGKHQHARCDEGQFQPSATRSIWGREVVGTARKDIHFLAFLLLEKE